MQPTYWFNVYGYARDSDAEDSYSMYDDHKFYGWLAAWTYLWRLQWAEVAAEREEWARDCEGERADCREHNEQYTGPTPEEMWDEADAALTAARLQAEPGRWLP